MPCSWLSEFRSFAAQKNELVRVVAVDYGDPTAPIDPELLGPLWLEFAGSPGLRLWGGSAGQGFTLDVEPPGEDDVPRLRDLGSRRPFAAVVDTPLEAVGLITWPLPAEEEEGAAVDFPVGIRLQFERGEAWILNVGDQIDLFDGRPPFWDDPDYSLSEWAADDERWGEGDVPSDLPPRWWLLAEPVDMRPLRERITSGLTRLLRR